MKSSWIIVALLVSLGANLLMAGYLLGREQRPLPSIDPTRGYLGLVRELPEARRGALMAEHRKARQERRSHAKALRAAHRQLIQALETEPLDTAALAATLIQLREIQASAQARGHEGFLALVQDLTPAERVQLSEAMKRPRRHGPRDRRPPPHRE